MIVTSDMNKNYDFQHADTKEYTHIFHTYPAMMIPQIARNLLKTYKRSDMKLLFDPYCGSGTSLVEASIIGLDSIGTDINPLARLISKTKTEIIDISKLDNEINKFSNEINDTFKKDIPNHLFKNINFWFKEKQIKELSVIKYYIDNFIQKDFKNFFFVAMSETIRDVSLTRNNEFKLYRIEEEKINNFNPCCITKMKDKLFRNRNGLLKYIDVVSSKTKTNVFSFNSVDEIPNDIIENESIDIVLTSPPYGDSKTTVAYGQFSRLSNQWFNFKDSEKIDNMLMGGTKIKDNIYFKCDILNNIISEISQIDNKRSLEVTAFFIDYIKSIQNISLKVKKDGIVIYVVGNRTVKGINIPTNLITQYYFEDNGFKHIETITRNIPYKRMPKENSPSNEIGKKVTTMNNEFIIVMKKINSNKTH